MSSPAFRFYPPLADSQEVNQRIKRKEEESKGKADQRKVKNPLSNESDPSTRGGRGRNEERMGEVKQTKERGSREVSWERDEEKGVERAKKEGDEDWRGEERRSKILMSRLRTRLSKRLWRAVNREGGGQSWITSQAQ